MPIINIPKTKEFTMKILPSGDYEAVISRITSKNKDLKDGTTKAVIEWEFSVTNENFRGFKIWHQTDIDGKYAFATAEVIRSADLSYQDGSDYNTDLILGRKVILTTVTQTYQNGQISKFPRVKRVKPFVGDTLSAESIPSFDEFMKG